MRRHAVRDRDARVLRYRCKIGHGVSGKTLLQDLAADREEAFWSALRAITEADLAHRLAEAAGIDPRSSAFLGRLAEGAKEQARRLRDIVDANSDLIEPPDYSST